MNKISTYYAKASLEQSEDNKAALWYWRSRQIGIRMPGWEIRWAVGFSFLLVPAIFEELYGNLWDLLEHKTGIGFS